MLHRPSTPLLLGLALLLSAAPAPSADQTPEVHLYRPEALPQHSDPAWAALGRADDLRAEVLDGVLLARTEAPAWSQWRLGLSADGQREFGDAWCLQVPEGGAITVDFRLQLPADAPALPCMTVAVSNGRAGAEAVFYPGEIRITGVTQPMVADTQTWGDYRLVIEGNKAAFYDAQTRTSKELELSEGNWGTYILFGFPAVEQDQAAERKFEIKALRWQPGRAERDFPPALE